VLFPGANIVFWSALALLFFTYAGYPLLIATLARRLRRPQPHPPAIWPRITVVLVARNESARIVARIENLLASEYPADSLDIVVVSDGSSDDTALALQNRQRVQVLTFTEHRGKSACLNDAIAAATGDIIVFADARQTFAPSTIAILVTALTDPRVGAVSGELQIAASAGGVGSGVDAYWRLERFLREREAILDSSIGCTGAVYAIRRALFTPLPADTILDDVVIPMRIAAAGHRIAFRADALAFDPQPLAPENEERRKTRTLAGNFQMLFRYPAWLFPWCNRLWWQLAAHKYLRLAGPLLLVAALVANAALAQYPFYRALLMAQFAFYAIALLGMVVPARTRIINLPAAFLFLNTRVLHAFWHYLTRRDASRWV
jgi:poly-beta-1,6-N-acetyl-D-glucosamine synthase